MDSPHHYKKVSLTKTLRADLAESAKGLQDKIDATRKSLLDLAAKS